jgi:hypothetical protein
VRRRSRGQQGSAPVRVEFQVHFRNGRNGHKELRAGKAAEPSAEQGNVPRVARLLALAHHFDELLRDGVVQNCAELAALSHVSRARITQIMNLLLLAPDIQEEILHLPRTVVGRDPIRETHLRPIVQVAEWGKQRRMWRKLRSQTAASECGAGRC